MKPPQLHPNHLRILSALQSATRVLRVSDSLTVVGSLGRSLAGYAQSVGDIDIKIDVKLCAHYWEFIEILAFHGVRSVFDVLDRPDFPWDPCYPTIAHARALTIDCGAHSRGLKHANLDVCVSPSDVDAIPRSERWVHLLDPSQLGALDDTARNAKIVADHQLMIADLRKSEKLLANRRWHEELKLHFAW